MKILTTELIQEKQNKTNISEVKNLHLWGMDLSDISIIEQMPLLEIVTFSANSIKTLESFKFLKNLKELYLRKNLIEDLNELDYLKECSKLRILWLSENPICLIENYRLNVINALPQITKLDNIVISVEELTEAKKLRNVFECSNMNNNFEQINDNLMKNSKKRVNSVSKFEKSVKKLSFMNSFFNDCKITSNELKKEKEKLNSKVKINSMSNNSNETIDSLNNLTENQRKNTANKEKFQYNFNSSPPFIIIDNNEDYNYISNRNSKITTEISLKNDTPFSFRNNNVITFKEKNKETIGEKETKILKENMNINLDNSRNTHIINSIKTLIEILDKEFLINLKVILDNKLN